MQQPDRIETLKQMLALIDQERNLLGESGTLRVSDYTCPQRLAAEKAVLFREYPVLAAHASQLSEPGSYVTLEVADVPLLVNRDRNGNLNAFINSCRHRGAKLATEPCGSARAFKCPYHAWSYMDDGELRFVPNPEAFPGLQLENHPLVRLPLVEAAGFIWVKPSGGEIDRDGLLGPVEKDLEAFGLADHVVRVAEVQRPACNWKLVIDAFSEGYHLKSLHKYSVEPFFLEYGTVFEQLGRHSRSVGARKLIAEAIDTPEVEWDFRAWTTPFYTLFPNTVLVFHPDWVSRITVFPDGTDHCVVHHDMLVPADADLSASYWDKTFRLINQQVFAEEDIAACEDIQQAARSGADQEWIIGGLETPVLWFHRAIDEALESA